MNYWCLKKGKKLFPSTMRPSRRRVRSAAVNGLLLHKIDIDMEWAYWSNWEKAGFSIVKVKLVEVVK